MKTITFTLTVPDHVQFNPLENKHARLADALLMAAIYGFDLDPHEARVAVGAEVPVMNPRRLGVITSLETHGNG
jgi:hypothetical protein